MANVENLKIGNTSYGIRDKNTLRSLTAAQETQLLANGTYEGEDVANGEVFTGTDGLFKKFSKTLVGESTYDYGVDTISFEADITTTQYFTTIGGNVTIDSSGVASGFNADSCVKPTETFNPSTDTWEIVIRIYPTSDSYQQYFFDKPYNYDVGLKFIYSNGGAGDKVTVYLTMQADNTGIALESATGVFPTNTWTYVKVDFDGEAYHLYSSSDGKTWTVLDTVQNSTPLYSYSADTFIGKYGSTNDNPYYFSGSIDLKKCYIKKNGAVWWRPIVTTITPMVP